jgi:hypothetical protein
MGLAKNPGVPVIPSAVKNLFCANEIVVIVEIVGYALA